MKYWELDEATKAELLEAVRKDNLQLVESIVLSKNLDLTDASSHVLLCAAISRNRVVISSWFLDRGVTCDGDWAPLLVAVQRGRNELVRLLLERGAPTQMRSPQAETALHICCKRRNLVAAEMLLSRDGSLLDAVDENASTALHLAAELGCPGTLELLLGHGPNLEARTCMPNYEGCTALHIAVMRDSQDFVKALLDKGADVNARVGPPADCLESDLNHYNMDYDGYTALHLAIKLGAEKIFDLLLDYSADVNVVVESSGETPLHLAVLAKNKRCVMLLSECKADFLARTKEGKNILHLAVESSWPELVEVLLRKNANINDKTSEGEAPLHIATKLADQEIVRLLMENGANINIRNSKSQTPLHLAAGSSTEVTELLLKHNASIDEIDDEYETPLAVAVRLRVFDTVALILSYKPSIFNPANKFIFFYAIKKFNYYKKIVRLLFDYGFTLLYNVENFNNLLNEFVSHGHLELAENLLNSMTKVNCNFERDNRLMYRSIMSNNINTVNLLSKYGYSIDYTDDEGQKVLYITIENNHAQVLDLLFSSGAKVQSAYIWAAAKFKDMNIMNILLKHGIDVNTSDEFGATMLHFAIFHGDSEFAKFLLAKKSWVNNIVKYDCEPNDPDYYSKVTKKRIITYPLHIAVSKKRHDLCLTLLHNYAAINCQNGEGRTALHIAAANICAERVAIIKTLLKYGADINIIDNFKRLPVYYLFNQTCVCNLEFQNQYELDDECDCNYDEDIEDVFLIFVKHIVYLQSMNKSIHQDNITILSKSKKNFEKLQDLCLLEIIKMKEEKIFDNASFYDLLVRKSTALAAYARNEDLIQAFKSSDYEKKFPLYADLLKAQFDTAEYRAHLLESSFTVFNEFFNLKFPQVVCDNIFDLLNTNDLNNICLARESICDSNIDNKNPAKKLKTC